MVKTVTGALKVLSKKIIETKIEHIKYGSDEDVAKAVQSGDVSAFEVLMHRYEMKINRYILRILPDYEEAQDLLQETFMKVYININSFDAKRRFSPWIYRIAHNEVINRLRQKKKEMISPFDLDTFLPMSLKEDVMNKVEDIKLTSAELNNCMGKLEIKYREPLLFFYLEELSYNDISDILRIPVSTVGVRIKRGKDMLKKICKEMGYEP
ncbi:MAG: ECF RNA polymerase sigma factor SigW [candidate division WS2 bacterium]|uniref:RNA polymerase sigma factor n=1 Tax=Psychracetigena formicireducens TaxID=2986056 RepID=A0A9E2BGA3_PSYF1|nr:ECF RNA polymerase sigma factor SigW [Candidatus Psychracetigena formicireducens]MBT9145055.1 ECF RNA polymerase sigma factor SigW [Candidatus Psychracetigena formicireducens]MBT9150415.1 ECF RNA polymerase sigma factor SigW [Candidatus Psychracetigena formicireducens]